MENDKAAPKITAQYRNDNLTIEILEDGKHAYEVDLERITDSASALDAIMQLAGKPWMTDEGVGALVREMNRAFIYHFDRSAQGKICGMGQNKTFEAGEWTKPTAGPDMAAQRKMESEPFVGSAADLLKLGRRE